MSIYFHLPTHRNQFPSGCWFIVCIFFVCGMFCLAVILSTLPIPNRCMRRLVNKYNNHVNRIQRRTHTGVSYNCLDVERNVNAGTEMGIKCFASGQYNLWLVNLCAGQMPLNETLTRYIKRCRTTNEKNKRIISTNRLGSVSKITIINSRDTRSYVLSTAKNHKKPAHTRRCGLTSAVRSISLSLSHTHFSFIIIIIFVFVCFLMVLLRVLPPLFHHIFSERIYFFGNLNKRLAKEMNEAEKKKHEPTA